MHCTAEKLGKINIKGKCFSIMYCQKGNLKGVSSRGHRECIKLPPSGGRAFCTKAGSITHKTIGIFPFSG